MSERFRSTDFIRFRIANDLEIIYSRTDQRVHVVSRQTGELLECCKSFKTLEGHASYYLQGCGRAQNGARTTLLQLLKDLVNLLPISSTKPAIAITNGVKKRLDELFKCRLLISETSLCRRQVRFCEPVSQSSITTVAVFTKQRLKPLEKCLTTHIENTKRYGRNTRFLVMDDSESVHERSRTRQLLLRLRKAYGIDLFYAGLEEKKTFIKNLNEAGSFPPGLCNFALLPRGHFSRKIGANRNAMSLATRGERVLGVDDDMVCSIAPAPNLNEGIECSSTFEFMNFYFFEDAQARIRSVEFREIDALAIHESLLGRHLHLCLAQGCPSDKIAIGQIDSHFLSHLSRGTGRVVVTLPGLVGDSGMQAPRGYLLLTGDSKQRLTQSEKRYQSALTSREILRTPNRVTVTNHPWCMVGVAAYDNSQLIPPFMPVQRNADAVFGLTLMRCVKDALIGHLPWIILHSPNHCRTYRSDLVWRTASYLRICDVLLAIIASFECFGRLSDDRTRLQMLGRQLIDVGSLSMADFKEFLQIQVLRLQSATLSLLASQIHKDNYPEFWRKDALKYLETLLTSLEREDFLIPKDLPPAEQLGAKWTTMRWIVTRFGELLYWWPEIVATTEKLQGSGIGLAAQI